MPFLAAFLPHLSAIPSSPLLPRAFFLVPSSPAPFHDIRHATATLLLKAGGPDPASNASAATRMRGRRSTLSGTSANEDLRAPFDLQPAVKPIAHDDLR